MRLRRFSVQGFKNFRAPVELQELGVVHLIHGGNNVGKSNLLEAMAVWFEVAGTQSSANAVYGDSEDGRDLFRDQCQHRDLPFAPWAELFSFDGVAGILLKGVVEIEAAELTGGEALAMPGLSRPRLDPPLPSTNGLEVDLLIEPEGGHVKCTRELRYRSSMGSANLVPFGLLAPISRRANNERRFELIQVDRSLLGDGPAQRGPGERGLISQALALKLYDAQQSLDPLWVGRWRLFQDLLGTVQDVTGQGRFVVLFNRKEGQALVAFEQGDRRIPAHLLGSGVQQIVALIGQILMTGADIIAIEEPELNLRFGLQRRVAELLNAMVKDPRGPSQLIMTSHSPAFEGDRPFDLITLGPKGPEVQRLAANQAARATEQELPASSPGSAPLSYLSSEGVLRIPHELAQHIGLPRGGSVALTALHEPRAVKVQSSEDWLKATGDDI